MSLNPITWSFAGKLIGVGLGVAVVAGGATTAIVGASSSEPGVASYLCMSSSQDMLLQWRQAGSDMSGTYQQADLSGTAPSEQVSSNQGGLSGTLDGQAVTLSIGFSQPVYGQLVNGTLTLNVPQQDGTIQQVTCNQIDIPGWNKMVGALNARAAQDNDAANQAAAQQQHDQQVSQVQQALSSDTAQLAQDAASLDNDKSLGTDVTSMQNDYSQEQADYQAEQSASCSDGSVSGDAGTVGGDAGTVGGALGSLQSDVASLQSNGISSVQTDLGRVQTDLADLQNLAVSPLTDSASAVAAGNKALTNAKNAIDWANGQGNTINSQAQQLAGTATSYASAHGC